MTCTSPYEANMAAGSQLLEKGAFGRAAEYFGRALNAAATDKERGAAHLGVAHARLGLYRDCRARFCAQHASIFQRHLQDARRYLSGQRERLDAELDQLERDFETAKVERQRAKAG